MEFTNDMPIYLQLKKMVEEGIITGTYHTDDTLPSIRNLAQGYRLNPQTVASAFSELMNDGVIYKKRGLGFFVAEKARENLLQRRKVEFYEKDVSEFAKIVNFLGIEINEICELLKKRIEEESR
ncbi:MAG: GntR family transcriptional regulator [Candidatus Zophobacter franzmannii]|jgi:DNA-binding transcriptional regulator YhcF (GntR family)|nr:GntR family transcriptional regulator [Candidatus Zophobacter franzmannii]